MFYNSQRITKAAIKELSKKNQISEEQNLINNHQKLIDFQNKEKMNDLLVVKYIKKCGIKKPQVFLEDEINHLNKGEKLKKIDLLKLNTKINEILHRQKSQQKIIKSKSSVFTDNEVKLPEIDPSSIKTRKKEKIFLSPIHSSMSTGNLKTTIPPTTPIALKNSEKENNNENNNNYKDTNNISRNTNNLNDISNESNKITSNKIFRKKKLYINPEEELAELEKELGLDENAEKPKKGYERLFKFFSEGNEWVAIDKYNQQLYDQEVEEEKIRNFQNKRKLKEELDKQVKDKIKKEYEESLEEEKYRQSFNEYNEKMKKIEKEKREELQKRFIIEKKSREEQIKTRKIMQRLELLKQKKFDKNIINNIKKELENEKKMLIEKKLKENETIRRHMKETENKMQKKLEKLKLQKEEDKNFCKELEKTEIKKELERKKILNRVRSVGDYEQNEEVKKILEKMRKDNENEDEKLKIYLIKKKKLEDEIEEKEKNRRLQIKKDLKKFLELQIEEKNREKEFERLLWKEQGKIWNKDSEKYNIERKMIDEKIKKMNLKNAEMLKEQIKNKKEENIRKNGMSLIEYTLNKNVLNKVMDSMEDEKNKQS